MAKTNGATSVHTVSVTLTFIPYEEASEKQRCAWNWLCRELLRPVGDSCRPQLHVVSGGRGSKHRRRNATGPQTPIPLGTADPRGIHDDDADFPGDSKRLDTPDDISETPDAV